MYWLILIQVVAQYLGYTDTFELLPKEEVSIHWPIGGQPHPNKPPCGFLGELCIVSSKSMIQLSYISRIDDG